MNKFLVVTLAPFSKAWKEMPISYVGDLVNAWSEGYDFKIEGGPYCSNRDIELMKKDGLDGVIIKFHGDTIQVKF